MKRRKLDSNVERRIAAGLIESSAFLASARSSLSLDDIEQPHFKKVVSWCFNYYDRHKKAPGKNMETMFYRWAESGRGKAVDVDAVQEFLSSLSLDVEDSNIGYMLDTLQGYVTERRLKRLVATVEDNVFSGDVDAAISEINGFRSINVNSSGGVDPFKDRQAWKQAFTAHSAPLLTFHGDAGRFLGSAFCREGLIGIQAPEKRGKTWWCLEFIARALRERRKVAFFEVGDLSENQVLMRLAVRLLGQPMWKSQCGVLKIPVGINITDGMKGKLRVQCMKKKCMSPVSYYSAIEGLKRFSRGCALSVGSPSLMVACYPTGTMAVKDIDKVLQGWVVEKGFVPDIVVIDYADILAPERKNLMGRDAVNESWAAMRRLAQERRLLVISPTQADADSYDRWIMGMRNFSEDKRKLSHVTGMLGLNQTEVEKKLMVSRLNWLVLREESHNPRRCLYVGQCPPLGRMMTCSVLQSEINRANREGDQK